MAPFHMCFDGLPEYLLCAKRIAEMLPADSKAKRFCYLLGGSKIAIRGSSKWRSLGTVTSQKLKQRLLKRLSHMLCTVYTGAALLASVKETHKIQRTPFLNPTFRRDSGKEREDETPSLVISLDGLQEICPPMERSDWRTNLVLQPVE